MALRIKPKEIEVPPDNPFNGDLLGRQEPIRALTNVIGNLEGGCVMAIDAGWGTGKTTFLRMWAAHLRRRSFPVVEFNAWTTDFTKDPFVALASEVTHSLQELGDDSLRIRLLELSKSAGRVIGRLSLTAAGFGVNAVSGTSLGSATIDALTRPQASAARSGTAGYIETKTILDDFRNALQAAASCLSASNDDRPLIVLIDELDRCRPTYAIELLETAKHLFDADRLVFVLCLDRTQLTHSIKAVYGSTFDSDGYLRRFFDIDYRLPDPDRERFIDEALKSVGVNQALSSSHVSEGQHARELLRHWLMADPISLRTVLQSVHRLGIVLASLDAERTAPALVLVALLILRTNNRSVYDSMRRQDTTDRDVIGGFFDGPAMSAIRNTSLGCTTEGTLIAVVALLTKTENGLENMDHLDWYDELRAKTNESTAKYEDDRTARARVHHILRVYERICIHQLDAAITEPRAVQDAMNVVRTIQSLELLPED